MPNPIDLLRGAYTPTPAAAGSRIPQAQVDQQALAAQAQAPNWKQNLQTGVEGGTDAILGLLGVGPDTRANRFGQLVGAAAPVMGATQRLVPSAAYLAAEQGGGADLMAAEKAMKWGGLTSPGTDPIEGLSRGYEPSIPSLPTRPAAERLGEQDPQFTPVGAEWNYNAGRTNPASPPPTPQTPMNDATFQKYVSKPYPPDLPGEEANDAAFRKYAAKPTGVQ